MPLGHTIHPGLRRKILGQRSGSSAGGLGFDAVWTLWPRISVSDITPSRAAFNPRLQSGHLLSRRHTKASPLRSRQRRALFEHGPACRLQNQRKGWICGCVPVCHPVCVRERSGSLWDWIFPHQRQTLAQLCVCSYVCVCLYLCLFVHLQYDALSLHMYIIDKI